MELKQERGPKNLDELIAEAMAATEARDAAEAQDLGITLDELHERRARLANRTSEAEVHDWVRNHEDYAPVEDLWGIVDETLQDREALRHVKAFLRTDWPFLILAGGVNCGKTVAALYAAWHSRPSRVVIAMDLPKVIEPKHTERENGWRAMPLHIPMCVLDDLGTENLDGRFQEAFFKFVNGRQSRRAKTVITCNLTQEQIAARYGERVARRFRQHAKYVRIKGNGKGAGL